MSEENNNIENINEPVEEQDIILEQDVIGKRFNWGAFFLTWIWGLGNKVWITLLIIPVWFLFAIFSTLIEATGLLVGFAHSMMMVVLNLALLAIQILFGVNGNRWAWKKKKYKSVEHFHKIQRIWAVVATILVIINIALVCMMTFPALMSNTNDVRTKTMVKKHVVTIDQSTKMMEAVNEKCGLTSEKIAECFAERLNINALYGKRINTADGAVYEFYGDGFCKTEGACYVLIDVNDDGKSVKLPLYAKSNGYLEVKQYDVDKYFVE